MRGSGSSSRMTKSHSLQKARDRKGRIDLKCPLEPPDVDAELQRCRCHRRLGLFLVAHGLLGTFAVGCRKVPVVDEEAVGLVVGFAVLAQQGAHGLGFFTRVDEHEAFAPACMLKDVADARVGMIGGRIGFGHEFRLGNGLYGCLVPPRARCGEGSCQLVRVGLVCPFEQLRKVAVSRLDALAALNGDLLGAGGRNGAIARLGARVVEMLHGQTPSFAGLVKARDNASAAGAGCQECPGSLGVAARHARQPFDQAERLPSAVAA